MTQDLTGRTAVVTGSTRGIGWAIAQALARAGADLLIHGVEPGAATERAAELVAEGRRAAASAADLARPDGVDRLAADLGRALRAEADILVICASREHRTGWRTLTAAEMAAEDAVNLHATVHLLQAFLPGMQARGWGRVLAIGSVQEERPNPQHFYYAATKAAQTSMILNLARSERGGGVTFNILRPGAIATDRNAAALADPAYRAAVLERIPLGRIGTAEDCAAAALLLCSPAGGYVNGAVLAVDGGLRL